MHSSETIEHGLKSDLANNGYSDSAVMSLRGDGLGPTAIAKEMGVGRASVYRILGDEA